MTAIGPVWPGTYSDTSLPTVGLLYTPPLDGAICDFAVDNLPLGAVTFWPSSVGSNGLVSDGTAPQVIAAGAGKAVAFDGITSRMRVPLVHNAAYTIVAVYRFAENRNADTVVFGYSSANEGIITASADGTAMYAASGGTSIFPSPPVTPDTNWHTAVLSVNGSTSALRIDGNEITGNLPIAARAGLNLGFRNLSNGRSLVEYKRVAMLAGGTTAWQRNSLVTQMQQLYGL